MNISYGCPKANKITQSAARRPDERTRHQLWHANKQYQPPQKWQTTSNHHCSIPLHSVMAPTKNTTTVTSTTFSLPGFYSMSAKTVRNRIRQASPRAPDDHQLVSFRIFNINDYEMSSIKNTGLNYDGEMCGSEISSLGGCWSTLMLCAAISQTGRSQLVYVLGNCNRTLRLNVTETKLPSLTSSGLCKTATPIFQQDNAGPTTRFLQNYKTQVLTWLSKSPDFNYIQHVWDELVRHLRQHQ